MNSLKSVVNVRISDLNVVMAPHTIRTLGLGSCVGVVIYDLHHKVAGLAHVMLPDSNLTRQSKINEYKFVDTALPILVERLQSQGARKRSLQAKMAGGAQMFQFDSSSDSMRIGPRNVEATEQMLKALNIPIISMDVGGKRGRTIEFDPDTGMLEVRTVYKGIEFI